MISCYLHTDHRPRPQGFHRHHVIPEAWTRALDLRPSRIVYVCPTGHDNLHRDLRDAIAGRTWYARGEGRNLVTEALMFYRAHPEAQHLLRTLADRLVVE